MATIYYDDIVLGGTAYQPDGFGQNTGAYNDDLVFAAGFIESAVDTDVNCTVGQMALTGLAATIEAFGEVTASNFSLRDWRKWHKPEDEQELKRRGLTPESAELIAEVAERQASESKEKRLDEQQRIEELRGELKLRDIELESQHLEALNRERERLIDEEIATRLKLQMDQDDAIILMLIAAQM